MTFAEFKKAVLTLAFPAGEPPHTASSHLQSIQDALAYTQEFVPCLRRVNVELIPHAATYYKCGTSAFAFSSGRVLEVGVVSERKRPPQPSLTPFDSGVLIAADAIDFDHLATLPARPISKIKYEYQAGVQVDLTYIVPGAYKGTKGSVFVQGAIYYKHKEDSENVYLVPGTQSRAARIEFSGEVGVNNYKRFNIIIEPAQSSSVWLEVNDVRIQSGDFYDDAKLSVSYAVFGPPASRATDILAYDAEWCGYIKYRYVDPQVFLKWYQSVSRDPELKTLNCCKAFLLPEDFARKAISAPNTLRPSPPYPYGYVIADKSYDSEYGRSYVGVWTLMDGMIHVAPWIQSYEAIVVRWEGTKKEWSDSDAVANDPALIRAAVAYVLRDHAQMYDKNDVFAQANEIEFRDSLQALYYNCVQESISVSKKYRSSVMDTVSSVFSKVVESPVTDVEDVDGSLYGNDEIRRLYTCPDIGKIGTQQVEILVPANRFVRPTKALANQKAEEYARQLAVERLNQCRESFGWTNTNRYTFTATCLTPRIAGSPAPAGQPATGTVEPGEVSSVISEDDANVLAEQLAQKRAFERLVCTYLSAPLSGTKKCEFDPPPLQREASASVNVGEFQQTVIGAQNADQDFIASVQTSLNSQAQSELDRRLADALAEAGCEDPGAYCVSKYEQFSLVLNSMMPCNELRWDRAKVFCNLVPCYITGIGTGSATVCFLYGEGDEYEWHSYAEAKAAAESDRAQREVAGLAYLMATQSFGTVDLRSQCTEVNMALCGQCLGYEHRTVMYGLPMSMSIQIKKMSEL